MLKNVKYNLMLGDNMLLLDTLEDNSIDAIVTDPPYGLKFMNKKWDYSVPSVDLWKKVYRVLKPGGYILSFGGTRTYHRMVVNCEDAGFEVRDCISWLYGSGFPKSLNISKAIDKKYGRINSDLIDIKNRLKELYKKSGKINATIDKECGFKASGYLRTEIRDDDGWGSLLPTTEKWNIIKNVIGYDDVNNELSKLFIEAEREVVGKGQAGFLEKNNVFEIENKGYGNYDLTKSKTEEGKKFEGFGSALKPAQELIVLARKPLSEGIIAENVLKWGTGGLNIDGCRISITDDLNIRYKYPFLDNSVSFVNNYELNPDRFEKEKINRKNLHEDRFPANIILDEESAKLLDEQSGFSKSKKRKNTSYGAFNKNTSDFLTKFNSSVINDGSSEYNDEGGASRFFYIAKVSKKERNLGCEESRNSHPTCKPIKLLTYLCRLITPPNGVILDPFMGSGSTGVAALLEGFNFIGMEKEPDYMKIAEARIAAYEEYKKIIK